MIQLSQFLVLDPFLNIPKFKNREIGADSRNLILAKNLFSKKFAIAKFNTREFYTFKVENNLISLFKQTKHYFQSLRKDNLHNDHSLSETREQGERLSYLDNLKKKHYFTISYLSRFQKSLLITAEKAVGQWNEQEFDKYR